MIVIYNRNLSRYPIFAYMGGIIKDVDVSVDLPGLWNLTLNRFRWLQTQFGPNSEQVDRLVDAQNIENSRIIS